MEKMQNSKFSFDMTMACTRIEVTYIVKTSSVYLWKDFLENFNEPSHYM